MTDWEAIQQNLEVAARAHRDGYESTAITELIEAVTQLADHTQRPASTARSIPADMVLANLPEHLEDRELQWRPVGYDLADSERNAYGFVNHYPHSKDVPGWDWKAYAVVNGVEERLEDWFATAEDALAAVEAFVRRVLEDAQARERVLEPEPF